MILDYLPFELALKLDTLTKHSLDGYPRCLRRLRQDPIAHRFERVFEVLGQRLRVFKHLNNEIKLISEMSAQFLSVGGRSNLQDMGAAATQTCSIKQAGRTTQLQFHHVQDRAPYIAVQVDDFGMTHIALDSVAGQPQWISPNTVNKQPVCFQDRSSEKSFDSVTVISDVSGAHRISDEDTDEVQGRTRESLD
jgi:hypothetical protein